MMHMDGNSMQYFTRHYFPFEYYKGKKLVPSEHARRSGLGLHITTSVIAVILASFHIHSFHWNVEH
jgi:hypothetical protein